MSAFESIVEQFLALDPSNQKKCLHVMMDAWKGTSKVSKRAKKERDPDAPKKEPNDFIKFASHIRGVFTANLEEADLKIAKSVKCVTQVASALKEADLMGTATDEQIVDAFAEWRANPPAPVTKAKIAAAKAERATKKSTKVVRAAPTSDSDSSDSSDSEEEAPAPAPKPKSTAVLLKASAERKKAASEKSAAVKTATKAAEAAAASVSLATDAASVGSATKSIKKVFKKPAAAAAAPVWKAEQEDTWEHDFGNGAVTFERISGDERNTWFIYHPTEGFYGLWRADDEFLDATVEDPCAD